MSDENGSAPVAEEETTVGERMLGVLGIAFGVVVFAIGIDLATGGALTRAIGLGAVADDDAEQS